MAIYKNHVIQSDLLPKVFSRLDESDFLILGYIAKHGINNQNRIGSKSQASLTNRQVNERISKLIKDDFLRIDKIVPWKIKGKNTKMIGLTYKGFLASLHRVPLSENILFKTKFHDVIISDIYSQVYNVILNYILEFLLYHKSVRIDLSNLDSETLTLYFNRVNFDYDLVKLDKKDDIILESIQKENEVMKEQIETFFTEYTEKEISNLQRGPNSEKSVRNEFLIFYHPFVFKWLCDGGKNIHEEFNKWRKNESKKPKIKFKTIQKSDHEFMTKPIKTKWKKYFPFNVKLENKMPMDFFETRTFEID